MSVVERFKTVHIWIGQTEQSEEEYDKYFEYQYNSDEDIYIQSQFDKDVAPNDEGYAYDEDFIGVIPLLKEPVSIQELLYLAIVATEDETEVITRCQKLGLERANAIVYYSDNTLDFSQPRESYNGLEYIGIFKSSL